MTNTTTPPVVSVIIPIYNADRYLHESIQSILDQSFTDFECILIDDGSTDDSWHIVQEFDDPRLRLYQNPTNRGLVYTLNRGIELAEGAYVARMDNDDIALPQRLEKQVAFMRAYPGVGVLGTNSTHIDETGVLLNDGKPLYPVTLDYRSPPAMKWSLIWGAGVSHPTVMLRRETLLTHNLRYNADLEYAEDQDLWNRCARATKVTYLPEVLLKYRVNSQGMSHKKAEHQSQQVYKITRREVGHLAPSLAEHPQLHALHRLMFRGEIVDDIDHIATAHLLLRVYRAFLRVNPLSTVDHQRIKQRALYPLLELAVHARTQHSIRYYRLLAEYYRYLPGRLMTHSRQKLRHIWNRSRLEKPLSRNQ